MANQLRGEVEVKLFGKRFTLRPDIESICEIEDAANGESSVANMFLICATSKGHLPTLKVMSWVIFGCLKAQGVRDYSLKDVMKEIRSIGLNQFGLPVLTLLRAMISEEEAKAEAVAMEEAKKKPESLEDIVASTG